PDYFLTVACNTSWIEITQALPSGQIARDQEDIVNLVFYIKLRKLQREWVTTNTLGEVSTLIWTLEFQKRGLPHAHMLEMMEPAVRLCSTEYVDAAICAKLP
ncbi:hypothetical protein EV356DRAFT_418929, partial [Viridothelium virens]